MRCRASRALMGRTIGRRENVIAFRVRWAGKKVTLAIVWHGSSAFLAWPIRDPCCGPRCGLHLRASLRRRLPGVRAIVRERNSCYSGRDLGALRSICWARGESGRVVDGKNNSPREARIISRQSANGSRIRDSSTFNPTSIAGPDPLVAATNSNVRRGGNGSTTCHATRSHSSLPPVEAPQCGFCWKVRRIVAITSRPLRSAKGAM